MNISTRVKRNSEPDPVVGASSEVNSEAGAYPEPIEGPDKLVTFESALYCAEDPRWDGCIGEGVARALARNYRGIEKRLREAREWLIAEEARDHLPPDVMRYILTGRRA